MHYSWPYHNLPIFIVILYIFSAVMSILSYIFPIFSKQLVCKTMQNRPLIVCGFLLIVDFLYRFCDVFSVLMGIFLHFGTIVIVFTCKCKHLQKRFQGVFIKKWLIFCNYIAIYSIDITFAHDYFDNPYFIVQIA